jgi:hypothetical protein
MHIYLWENRFGGVEATLDPALLEQTYSRLGGTGRVITPAVGEEIVLTESLGTSELTREPRR